jgi:hypothetical protein
MKAVGITLIWVGMLSAAVQAQPRATADDRIETLDLTMILMPEGATTPAAVTRTIELPAAAAEQARERAARGLDTANGARGGPLDGPAVAADARERARDLGRELSEQAQQNRENLGRGPPDWAAGSDRPGPSESPPVEPPRPAPELPMPPETPGTP